MANVDIDDVFNTLGFGRMQMIIFFGCAMQQFYVTNEQFGISLITVAARCELGIGNHHLSWLMTAGLMAQVCTSHYMGYKSDEIGRRKLLLITSTLTIFTSFISSLMPEFWSYLVMRFINGCVLTGPGMAVITYMGEFTKIKLRPMVLNFLCYSIGISMLYVPASALVILPQNIHLKISGDYAISGWRVLSMTNLLPGILSVLILLPMPESPKYYLSVQKTQEALDVLEMCCRYNKGKNVTLKSLGIESVTQSNLRRDSLLPDKNFFRRVWNDTKPLLQGNNARYMLLVIGIMFFMFATGAVLTVWMPRVIKMTEESEESMILCDVLKASGARNTSTVISKCHLATSNLLACIYHGGACLAGFMLISVLLICLNRKPILVGFSVLSTLSGFMLNLVIRDELVIAAFVLLVVPTLCSMRLTLTVIIDVVATHLRSKAVALAMMFGRFGVLVGSIFVGYTLNCCCLVTFNVYVAGMAITILLIFFLPEN
ncbi:synaptic vesicle glycoprotein 2B-like isoform X2 [Drosophila montana]|uniref:synaptic vesicle glycoprotein 2B-like isoform X2 n=2 Tax=Drosophila montana TaxID=40370 RepID=UPI00313CA160